MKNCLNDLSIVKKHYRGKVRDIYDLGDKLLIVTSDRISAYDVVFDEIIANKGKILNGIAQHFFNITQDICPNHVISSCVDDYPLELHAYKYELTGRSMLVKKAKVIPFECIVRGYITGSAWNEYKVSQTIGKSPIRAGLAESEAFPNPIFTPSTKADEGHDENISYKEMCMRMDKSLCEKIKKISLELFNFAHAELDKVGIILADTKFEFGTIGGKIYLIDEIFTPDSSRFWDKNEYSVGKTPKSYDKQFIRDYISNTGWDKNPPAPSLPAEIIQKSYDKYAEAYYKITGKKAE